VIHTEDADVVGGALPAVTGVYPPARPAHSPRLQGVPTLGLRSGGGAQQPNTCLTSRHGQACAHRDLDPIAHRYRCGVDCSFRAVLIGTCVYTSTRLAAGTISRASRLIAGLDAGPKIVRI
jgi:hypothetical protein